MPQYKYITKEGKEATVEAVDPTEAISKATNRDPASGVQLITAPTIPPVTPPVAPPVTPITTPIEGQIRTNPQTGQQEILTPEGTWKSVTPEEALWQAAPSPAPWQITPTEPVTPITPVAPTGQYTHPAIKSRDLIIEGGTIKVPGLLDASYRILPGDTLSGIASKYGTTVDAILTANGLNPAGPTPVTPIIPTPTAGVVTSEEQRQKEAEAKAEADRLKAQTLIDQQKEIASLTAQKAIQDLKASLGITDTAKPAIPTYASDFEALRSEQGITAIEARINSINSQIANTEASLRAGLYTEEGKLRPMELIGTRQRELTRQAQEQLDTLNRSKQVLVDEYNIKANLINNIMKFKEMDYTTATNAYNTQFTQAIQLQTLLMTVEERALAEQNRLRDDSRANLTILQNLITDSGQTWDQVSPAIQSQIQTLESKAGLPTGVIQTFLSQKPGMKIDHVTSAYDAQGRQVVSFFSYNNGDPQLMKSIYTGGVQQPTLTEQREAALNEAKNAMDAKLKSVVGTGGFISSADYKTQKEIWMRAGYDPKDFDKAFRKYTDPTQLWSYGLEPL